METDDEAIEVANSTSFGLGSAVFSRDRGLEIARQLRAGMTSINGAITFATISSLPFGGGAGISGFGRKHGDEGLLEFARPHAISIKLAEPNVNAASFSAPDGLLEQALARASAQAIAEANSVTN